MRSSKVLLTGFVLLFIVISVPAVASAQITAAVSVDGLPCDPTQLVITVDTVNNIASISGPGGTLPATCVTTSNSDVTFDSNAELLATTTAQVVSGAATIPVASTTGFNTTGKAFIGGSEFSYTGVTSTSFTGVTGVTQTFPTGTTVAGSLPQIAALSNGATNQLVLSNSVITNNGAVAHAIRATYSNFFCCVDETVTRFYGMSASGSFFRPPFVNAAPDSLTMTSSVTYTQNTKSVTVPIGLTCCTTGTPLIYTVPASLSVGLNDFNPQNPKQIRFIRVFRG